MFIQVFDIFQSSHDYIKRNLPTFCCGLRFSSSSVTEKQEKQFCYDQLMKYQTSFLMLTEIDVYDKVNQLFLSVFGFLQGMTQITTLV